MAGASEAATDSNRRNVTARVLALLALVACVVAVYLLVADVRPEGAGDRAAKKARSGQVEAQREKGPETYVVQAGDTLTGIAQKTGVSTAALERLNPDLDPATLNMGQTLKLR
ncbi:MAG: LysM peptidoglycan-binding domain-containing protein [Actinomycetota bacterium]|nr:LysM peptidoglycan-binding domain-containing protein [Actinomycetota bacterium]